MMPDCVMSSRGMSRYAPAAISRKSRATSSDRCRRTRGSALSPARGSKLTPPLTTYVPAAAMSDSITTISRMPRVRSSTGSVKT